MNVYDKMKELKIELPQPPAAGGIYSPIVKFGGGLVYTSGHGPIINNSNNNINTLKGKVGQDLTIEQGQEAARLCILNILSTLHAQIGDLNRVEKIVKILGFVASADNFYDQPKVMDAASKLLCDIFGEERGRGARSAIGTNALPGNIAVEIEILLELTE